jgi:reverse transcriptase-like protein
MDRLDRFIHETLIPAYSKGDKRRGHAKYQALRYQIARVRQQGNLERIKILQGEMRQYPSQDPNDPEYRRLRYIRYADDFLLGFAGPKTEAEEIKEKITTFLGTELKLTLSAEKTLITHAQTERARFLGYEIGMLNSQTKLDRTRGTRTVNGKVGMYIPDDVIQSKRKRYMRDGKPIHRPELLNDSE